MLIFYFVKPGLLNVFSWCESGIRLLGCSQEDVAQYFGWKSGEVAKRYMQRSGANASVTILESVFPRVASDLVTPVVHTDNLDAAV